jgi:hypothetical protein
VNTYIRPNIVVEWLTLLLRVREVLDRRPAILSEVFHEFPQSLKANAGTVNKIRPRQILSTSFPFLHSSIILSFDAVYSEPLRKRR